MKLASYRIGALETCGLLTADDSGLIALPGRIAGVAGLRDLLALPDWAARLTPLAGLPADHRLADVTLLPVIPDPRKILCIGINYASHVRETGREMPDKPMVFTRFADSQVGHDQPLLRPFLSERFDWEAELAVIIGRRTRHATPETAMASVAGYSCYNDGSLRDWQRHTTQFTPGKNFPATGAFGPWMVTAEAFGPVETRQITLRLNGQVMQQARFDDLIFGIADLIAYCSAFTTLEPGDVIITGTPGGVGGFRQPPIFLRAGDVTEVEIDGIGILRNPVEDEQKG